MHRPSRSLVRRLEVTVVVIVLVSGLADAISTAVGLHHGARELNAGAMAVADWIGFVPMLVLRVLPPAIGASVLVRWASRDRVLLGAAVSALALVVVGWTVVAANNTSVVL